MTTTPPPVGPNLQKWARATRAYLQRWLPRLQWKTADSNPSENGIMLWDETQKDVVVSRDGVFERLVFGDEVPEKWVIVREAADLSGALLSDVVYVLDGVIDMGSTQITVPQGGLTIQGFDFDVSGLTSSENSYTMFIDDGVYSGNLIMRRMKATVSGTGSQVFDIDNDGNGGAVECTDFNFVSCTSLGTIDSYRQGLFSTVGLISCVDGFTMEGTWDGGFAILTSILISAGTAFTGTLIKKGTATVINGSIRSDINALQLDSTGQLSDFAPSNITNDAQFRMDGVRCNSAATPFPNMPASDTKARFSKCVGFRNTYVGAQWSISSESTTTISAANTPVKIAGTTTYTDENWFTNTTDNAFVYDAEDEIGAIIHGELSFTGTNGNQINVIIRHWVDSSSSYTNIAESGAFTVNAGGRAENVGLHAFCDLNQNDRIEVWVENQSSSNNVTAKLGGIVSVNERAS